MFVKSGNVLSKKAKARRKKSVSLSVKRKSRNYRPRLGERYCRVFALEKCLGEVRVCEKKNKVAYSKVQARATGQ